MTRPLATLAALMLVATLFMGFASGPVAAQCSSTSVSTDAAAASNIVNTQTSVQINVANNIQTGVAVSLAGDSVVSQLSTIDLDNDGDLGQC